MAWLQRKLDFDARLKSIEENGDSLALATPHEFELWGEITAIERNPALQANIPEADEVRSKVKLLKGALQWTLDREFRARLSKIRQEPEANRRSAGRNATLPTSDRREDAYRAIAVRRFQWSG